MLFQFSFSPHLAVSILHVGRSQALFTWTVTEVGGRHWISDLLRDWPRVYFWMHPHLWAGILEDTCEGYLGRWEEGAEIPSSWDAMMKFQAVPGCERSRWCWSNTEAPVKYPQSSVYRESACWLSQVLMVLCLQEMHSRTRKHWLLVLKMLINNYLCYFFILFCLWR